MKEKFFDNHLHLINYRVLPDRYLSQRIPEAWAVKLARLVEKNDFAVESIEYLYNLIPGLEDIDIQPFLLQYIWPLDQAINRMWDRLKYSGMSGGNLILLDLEPNWGPNIQLSWHETIKTVKKINKSRFKIFLHCNLKRPINDIMLDLETYKPDGIKIYPKLAGNKPGVEHYRIWNWCEKNNKTAIVHCSAGGIGDKVDNVHPGYWWPIACNHPYLKICFAHHGRSLDVANYLAKIMMENSNFYVDVSFDSMAVKNTVKYFRYLRELIDKVPGQVLFGSDYPLFLMQYSYRMFRNRYVNNLGYNYWKLIASQNYQDFMKWRKNGFEN